MGGDKGYLFKHSFSKLENSMGVRLEIRLQVGAWDALVGSIFQNSHMEMVFMMIIISSLLSTLACGWWGFKDSFFLFY